MTREHGHDDVDFDASYEFDSDIEIYFDADLNLDSYVDVDHDYSVEVCIDGNEAVFQIDVQAYGDDSSTMLNLVVFVDEDYSSITATGWAAVA